MMDDSIFLQLMGDTPILRVLDFLVVHDDFDYSMTDIAHHAGVGYATLKQFWPQLEQHGFVKQTRAVGKAKMYTLNREHAIAKKFHKFYWDATKYYVRDGSGTKKEAIRA